MSVIEFKPKRKLAISDSYEHFKGVFTGGLEVNYYDETEVMISFSGRTFWWVTGGEMILGSLDGLDFYLPIGKQEIEMFGLTHVTAASTIIRFCKKILEADDATKNA